MEAGGSVTGVAILGVGMHPWGKRGDSFVGYGIEAALAALADAGVDWRDVQFVAGADTIRNGYPGYVAGATFVRALGLNGARVSSSYAGCTSGVAALESARTRILAGLCDVALVVGADTTARGFLAPNPGERWDDPDWLRFRLVGATNPTYFALDARRRMDVYGATPRDFAMVKVKNAQHGLGNPYVRYRKKVTEEEVLASAMVANPLHLLDICATSDGAAAVVLSSLEYAKRKGVSKPVRVQAVSTVMPKFPNTLIELPNFATDSTATVPAPERTFLQSIVRACYEEAGIGPDELDVAEVYDVTTAMELDWYENIGLCEPGEAERLLNDGDTTLGGRIPVNPSGGLACFGEAPAAQAIAQVCEITWQLRDLAAGRQVGGAMVGITANKGLFSHGSSVLLTR
jgi:acetyl-CoA acetyltransferase